MTQFTENIQELLNVVAEVGDGEGPVVNTGEKGDVKRTGNVGIHTKSTSCRFTQSTTAFTGTAMAVNIVAEIGGADVILGGFTDVAAIGSESIIIEMCPLNVKAVYIEDTVTDWDATIHSVRF